MRIVFDQEAQDRRGGFRSTAVCDAMILVATGSIMLSGSLAAQGRLSQGDEYAEQMYRVYSYLMDQLEEARAAERVYFVPSSYVNHSSIVH